MSDTYDTCPVCGRSVRTTQRMVPGGGGEKILVEHSSSEPTGWLDGVPRTPYVLCPNRKIKP